MANRLMQFFKFEHLPAHLQEPSRSCAELAQQMDDSLPESAEKTAGLRKLLEAKDCFVRAKLEATTAQPIRESDPAPMSRTVAEIAAEKLRS